MPSYKGGENSFISDFGKKLNYDFHEGEKIQTELRVQFVISKKGQLIGARIHNKKIEELTELEKAGLEVLQNMQNWEAGMHNKKPVDVILTKLIHIDIRP